MSSSNPPISSTSPGNPESNGMGKKSIRNSPTQAPESPITGSMNNRSGSTSPFGTSTAMGTPSRAASGGADFDPQKQNSPRTVSKGTVR